MRTYKSIEKKSAILGMPINDLALLLFMLVGLVMIGSVVSIFITVSKYYYFSILLLIIATYLFLKMMNRRAHPGFITSALSYHFKQAKKITLLSNSAHTNSTYTNSTHTNRAHGRKNK